MESLLLNNPGLLRPETLIQRFLVRRELLEELLDNFRCPEPRHLLLTGLRGMGKTTMLHRLSLAIQVEGDLLTRFRPLTFPEEQYNVNRLSDFYLNCLDALADSLEKEGRKSEAGRVDELVSNLGRTPDAEDARGVLIEEAARLGQSLILLVDNAERVLEELDREGSRQLARLLRRDLRLIFVGATTNPDAEAFSNGFPFGGIFRQIALDGITLDETQGLLAKLAEQSGNQRISQWLKTSQPGRLTALHLLTGGNLRTLLILYQVLSAGLPTDIKSELDALIDQVTPLYKARFEEQAPQAQKILLALAEGWPHVQTARDLVIKTGEAVNTISAQLARLTSLGLVEKGPERRENRETFLIVERFFSLWLIMRASRRARHQVRMYAQLLEVLYSREEIDQEAHRLLDKYRAGRVISPDHARILVEAISEPHLRRELRMTVRSTIGAPTDWLDDFIRFVGEQRLEKAAEVCRKRVRAQPSDAESFNALAWCLTKLGRFSEAERECREAIRLDPQYDYAWSSLGDLLTGRVERYAEAEQAYREAIAANPKCTYAWSRLGDLLTDHLERYHEAEQAYREAISADPKYAYAWSKLGDLLTDHLERYQEAEQAYREAIATDPSYAYLWVSLGDLLTDHLERHEEAEQAYREAISADPKYAYAWSKLGALLTDHLERHEEAEQAFRQAITTDPKYAHLWLSPGELLADHLERHQEAEQAYREAIAANPKYAYARNRLDNLLWKKLRRYGDAERLLGEDFAASQLPHRGWTATRPLVHSALMEHVLVPRLPAAFRQKFLPAAVKSGNVAECVQLLDDLKLGQEWLPIREALLALERPERLEQLVPEVREPAKEIYGELQRLRLIATASSYYPGSA